MGNTIFAFDFGIRAEAKDLEDVLLASEEHGHALSATFFVTGGDGAEYTAPGFAGLVPGCNWFFGDGRDGGV